MAAPPAARSKARSKATAPSAKSVRGWRLFWRRSLGSFGGRACARLLLAAACAAREAWLGVGHDADDAARADANRPQRDERLRIDVAFRQFGGRFDRHCEVQMRLRFLDAGVAEQADDFARL